MTRNDRRTVISHMKPKTARKSVPNDSVGIPFRAVFAFRGREVNLTWLRKSGKRTGASRRTTAINRL